MKTLTIALEFQSGLKSNLQFKNPLETNYLIKNHNKAQVFLKKKKEKMGER